MGFPLDFWALLEHITYKSSSRSEIDLVGWDLISDCPAKNINDKKRQRAIAKEKPVVQTIID